MSHNINLHSIFETNKLTWFNYIDWLRNVKIVLRSEKLTCVLSQPVPPVPAVDASVALIDAYQKHVEDMDVACSIMLVSMNADLQKQHEHMDAPNILRHLQELFEEQSRTEIYEISKALFRYRMVEGSSTVQHGLKMNGYIEQLASLGVLMDHELSIDLILQSLPNSYASFVQNYQMNKISTTIPELVNMLKNAEEPIKKHNSKVVMVVGSSSSSKRWKKKKNTKKTTSTQDGVKQEEEQARCCCFD